MICYLSFLIQSLGYLVKIIRHIMSVEHKQNHNQPSSVSTQKTYFRLRELKNTLISSKLASPSKHYDYYSFQKNLSNHIQPIETKVRNTSFNFNNRISPKPSSKDQSKERQMRRTFYGTNSKNNDQRPPSSSRSVFGRSSLNFHQQNIFKDESNQNYLNKYTIIKELGKGSFSTVYLAQRQQKGSNCKSGNPETDPICSENIQKSENKTGNKLTQCEQVAKQKNNEAEKEMDNEWVAIKVYQKFKMGKEPHKLKNIKKEINLMQNMENQGVAKLYQSVETLTKISLVVEYGGDQSLLQYVKRNHPLPMRTIKSIAFQLISAIGYLHSKNIVHRDIKLQNILIHKDKTKLIDFGFSCLTHKQQKLTTICGTPNYMAPEVISRKDYIGQQADIWSFGVVVFALAQGRHPFKADTYNQLQRLVNRGKYELRRAKQQSFSDFLKKVLRVKGDQRPSAKEIAEMEWIRSEFQDMKE